jgi:hypothetical protein
VTTTLRARRTTALVIGTALVAAALSVPSPVAASDDPPPPPVAPGGDYLIGATYFSGWHSGDNFHFQYKNGQDWRPDHPEREPSYGWYDDTQAVMDAQIDDAASNGLDYFSFDWYAERPSHNDGGVLGQLHNGMNLFRTSPERDRMSYLVNYINGSAFSISSLRTPGMSQAQYETVRDAEWDLLTTQWVDLFQDPEYLKIDGKPLIEIYDVQRFTVDFSTGTRPDWNPHELAQHPEERSVAQAAIQTLKNKAALAGFPDVLIGGGLQQPGFSGEYIGAHDYDGMYDWFSAYGWHDMKRVPDADNDYYNLIRDNHDYVWDSYARFKNPDVDYVPLVTSGWDDVVNPQYNKWSINRTPAAFGDYMRELKSYLDEHPQTNLAPGSEVHMAKIGSWNELFEGHSIVPTKAEGTAYVAEVAKTFGHDDPDTPPTPRITVGADDYSVTIGQSIALRFDAVADGTVANVQWTLRHPPTWPASDVPLAGAHTTWSLTVPAGVGDGVLYPVSDLLPGVGPSIGNRQEVTVDYSLTVDGAPLTGSVPLTLTIVPAVTGRVLASSPDGSSTDITVMLHNQSHAAITGTLNAEPDAGVTLGSAPSTITLQPDERFQATVEATNATTVDLSAGFTFTHGGVTLDVGSAVVPPVEIPYGTIPALDGAVRSDGLVESANANGRLQVGNVSRTADGTGGNTEYRMVFSFPLDQIEGDPVRGIIELTEFEAGSPPALSLERISARTDITATAFDQPALASVAFPITGSPPAEGIVRRIDVTPWLLAAYAAGDTHLTVRLRMDTQVPGQTQYRTFRPTEYTPSVAADAPTLKIVAAPQPHVDLVPAPSGDGNVRSDGLIELANGNGRLQVGNVVRADGSRTEYRTLLTFDLTPLAGEEVARARLRLTEYETGGAPAVVADRLTPTGTLTVSQYGSPALASLPFPLAGAGSTAGVTRTLDITRWVQDAVADGATHLTVRLAQDAPSPTVTTYRAFRAVEATPDIGTDAPQLSVDLVG